MSFSHAKRARRLKRDKARRNKIKQDIRTKKRHDIRHFIDPIDRTRTGGYGV